MPTLEAAVTVSFAIICCGIALAVHMAVESEKCLEIKKPLCYTDTAIWERRRRRNENSSAGSGICRSGPAVASAISFLPALGPEAGKALFIAFCLCSLH